MPAGFTKGNHDQGVVHRPDEWPTAFGPEPPELVHRPQTFITEFAKDGRNTYGTFS